MTTADDHFKGALASWASGISVVTTNAEGLLYGLTVSSFSSVSLDPPLIMVCLANTNRMARMIQDAQTFAVSILGAHQQEASGYFATPGREPTTDFVQIDGEWTVAGVPVVSDAMAYVVCELHETHAAGDHQIVIGRVVHAVTRPGEPLVYFRRGYHTLAPETAIG